MVVFVPGISRCLEVDGCDTVEMHNIIEILLEIYRYYGWYIICDTVEILLKGLDILYHFDKKLKLPQLVSFHLSHEQYFDIFQYFHCIARVSDSVLTYYEWNAQVWLPPLA